MMSGWDGRELIDNLTYARDHWMACSAWCWSPREAGVKRTGQPSSLVMRLVTFNPKTGEFVAEVVHEQKLRRVDGSSNAAGGSKLQEMIKRRQFWFALHVTCDK